MPSGLVSTRNGLRFTYQVHLSIQQRKSRGQRSREAVSPAHGTKTPQPC